MEDHIEPRTDVDKGAMIIVFAACALSGFIVGLLVGHFLW